MLKGLYIRNYALIKEIEIDFDGGFNIITGETGAGKSIILGALGLILGNRADSKTLDNTDSKCIIEGTFQSKGIALQGLFAKLDLDFDDDMVLRREITPSGKSRAFVNDTPVSLNDLKEVGEKLVDIHSQHSNQLLNDAQFRLDLLDTFAKNDAERTSFSTTYKSWKEAKQNHSSLLEETQNQQRDLDYFQFQLDEIESLNLTEEEFEANEQELNLLNSAEKIGETIGLGKELLDSGENTVLQSLAQLKNQFFQLAKINSTFNDIYKRFESAWLELNDLNNELDLLGSEIDFNPERLNELNDRQQNIQRLLRKHSVESLGELLEAARNLKSKIQKSQNTSEDLEYWLTEMKRREKLLLNSSKNLSQSRKNVLTSTSSKITNLLTSLGIPDARFEIHLEELPFDRISANGQNKANYRFSANKGGQLGLVQKSASGGEISRIMLTLKFLLAGSSRFPTMIFDEIDLGISGEVAIKMGSLLSKMSENHQIISITHLPQIAAMGNRHFKVSKFSDDKRSYSQIDPLQEKDRISEISQMIGGSTAGESAVESAKELLQKFATLN